VIYLEASKTTLEELEIQVVLPPSSGHGFRIQTVELLEYSIEGVVGTFIVVTFIS
jgi:hypothetical protein